MEFIHYISEQSGSQEVAISDLGKLAQQGLRFDGTILVVHPREDEYELLRQLVKDDVVARLFVMVWSPHNLVRAWLEGLGARELNTGITCDAPDALQKEAAKCMVAEQYNGLSTGSGKAAVVQLLRAFTEAGYPLEREPWLQAFFAAGGEFRHAETISKLISEMKNGTKHRVQQRYRPEILSILRERATTST
jgi:hypothetical protein